MTAWEIDTTSKRARLAPRKNPYWRGIAGGRGGLSLGYRRVANGVGAWIAKMVVDGQRVEGRIGFADDSTANSSAIGYRAAVAQALEWSVQQHAALVTTGGGLQKPSQRPTVRAAVEAYVKVRKARSERLGKNAEGRLLQYALSDATFANTQLFKLQSVTIEAWRARLPLRSDATQTPGKRGGGDLALTTVDRLLNDLRAALNQAGLKYRRELPAAFTQEVRIGTKATGARTDARRQLLTEEQIRAAVEAAFEVDDSGDFGRLLLLLASTGARHSQAIGLDVTDLQEVAARVMMPGSKKGRSNQAKPKTPVPLSPETIRRLSPAVEGRPAAEPLLMRWQYRRVDGQSWERAFRRKWGPAYETNRFWDKTIKRAGLPKGTVMYALRHSSIVRGLRAMLPVRLVAALHDTSVAMIEQHYSACIVDATEDLARRAVLSFASDAVPVRVVA